MMMNAKKIEKKVLAFGTLETQKRESKNVKISEKFKSYAYKKQNYTKIY